jgi:two-component system NtrC family sensor kinase
MAAIPHPIYVVNSAGIIIDANPALEDLTGWPLEDLLGKRHHTIFAEDELIEKVEKELIENGYLYGEELVLLNQHGEKLPVYLFARSRKDDLGNASYIATLIDATERKKAEEQIRQSEERYRLLAENAADVILTVDMNMRPTYISPSVTRLLGYSVEEAMVKTMEEVVTTESFEVAMKALEEELAIENTENKDFSRSRTFEQELIRKDGSIASVEVNCSFLRDSGGKPISILVIARDITERKRIEEQLIMADRLAAIGELASGIAHELRNPLTSIIGFSRLIMESNIPEEIKENLNFVYSEAQRAAGIVNNVLTFARKYAPAKQLTQINNIIEEVLQLRAHDQKVRNIEVNCKFASDLPEVMVDCLQMQQVFLNIIINAESAMLEAHNRGTITITTEKVDHVVRISIADDGPGIAKETMEYLFDSFFTTKEVGKGTGLGLSICHGIVTKHDGCIYARSKLGEGANFFIDLPMNNHK